MYCITTSSVRCLCRFVRMRHKCSSSSHNVVRSLSAIMVHSCKYSSKVEAKSAISHNPAVAEIPSFKENDAVQKHQEKESKYEGRNQNVKRSPIPTTDIPLNDEKSILFEASIIASENGSDPMSTDNKVTLFFKTTETVLELRTDKQPISIFVPRSNQIISLDRRKERNPAKLMQEKPEVESIEEFMWREQKLNLQKIPQYYLQLSKIRLTGLVVVTTMAGYAMAPCAFSLLPFTMCTLGTGLTSCAANSINQFLEVPYDSQMNRTKNRVLVKGIISPLHTMTFAAVSGTVGLSLLALAVNPLTAALGAFNLGLYTMVYTPMKRVSIANTWMGSVVGAIPPMMGWTACCGALDPGAWLLGAILYAWQFPHFNALSWNLRPDYSRGGYRMSSVLNPDLCKRVSFRYCVGMIGLCSMAPVLGVTTWTFAVDSLPLNVYLSYLGWRFYRDGDSKSSRKLFRFSLVHIPALLMLMLISKKSFGEKPKEPTPSSTSSDVLTLPETKALTTVS